MKSDTHLPRGARRLPAVCVRRIAGADLLLHAGDFSTLEVLRELAAIGPPVIGDLPEVLWRRSRPVKALSNSDPVDIGEPEFFPYCLEDAEVDKPTDPVFGRSRPVSKLGDRQRPPGPARHGPS